MDTRVDQISDRIYRISTCIPEVAPGGFTFNQFLVDAEEPLLYHTGMRHLFPLVKEAIERVMPVERLRWISFAHVEADECGAVNEFLAVAPHAQVAHGELGCLVSLNDLCDRPPRPLADGEVLDIGGAALRRRLVAIPTPHVPHNWESHMLFEQDSGTLLLGDLCTQLGDGRDGGGPARRRGRRRGPVPPDVTGPGGTGNLPAPRRPRAHHARGDARLVVRRGLPRPAQGARGRVRGALRVQVGAAGQPAACPPAAGRLRSGGQR